MNLFPRGSLWLLPSGNLLKVVSFDVRKGLTMAYPDGKTATFVPDWIYRVAKRIGA